MQNSKDKIHFIITGGTIDSYWQASQDMIAVGTKSVIPEYFEKLAINNDFDYTEVCMKDSRALTPENIKAIHKAIEESDSTQIIVTHGRYTMPDTMKYLQENLTKTDQTIVFTGATTPLKGFEFSDAAFNLGFAVAKVTSLKPGIYIAMNSHVFPLEKVLENLAEGKYNYLY